MEPVRWHRFRWISGVISTGRHLSGGTHGDGVIFEMKRVRDDRYLYSVIYSFCDPHPCGNVPVGALVIDIAGNVYGVVNNGGEHYVGQVFELSPGAGHSGWTFRDLYDFCPMEKCPGGGSPNAGLAFRGAGSGKLYDGISPLFGTTLEGGTDIGGGTVYEVRPAGPGPRERTLYQFCSKPECADGNRPAAPVIVDGSGNIYGTTYYGGIGGIGGAGLVFRLDPQGGGWSESVLYRFCALANCADGLGPQGGVKMDGSGNLFGVTPFGGRACNI